MDIAPALEALDRHADKLRAELDTVATIRKMLLESAATEASGPSLGWVSLSDVLIATARACPVCGAPAGSPCSGVRPGVTHLDRFQAAEPTPEPPTPSGDPLDHRCPACGALPGTDCVGLDWGVFHSARPGTGWKHTPKAEAEPTHDMRRARRLSDHVWEVTAGGKTIEVTKRYSAQAGRMLYFPGLGSAGFPTLVAVQEWMAKNA